MPRLTYGLCSYLDCEKEATYKELLLCSTHYAQQRNKNYGECSVEGCLNIATYKKKQMCGSCFNKEKSESLGPCISINCLNLAKYVSSLLCQSCYQNPELDPKDRKTHAPSKGLYSPEMTDEERRIIRNEQSKIWRQENPKLYKKVRKNYNLKRDYGITIDDYFLILQNQNYCCKICKKHESEFKIAFAVDHSHKTGKVRGLLCMDCNIGLGLFKDDIMILDSAKLYLKESE